ncbi:7-cyano-7-deazaguanine reductase [Chthonomonas calidirosea]|uniref:NADPH-dependent 7-cyano-7-deazaguanine reductase n=1 Tax=Chthonomonas calidirosea (strain DSM 23976 / ICMP 18418 / T49) TaxID=1303518 RepID=S0EV12_CHTCT|nr:preQ(1) synthase [Chthonomonas calidirosea]CCW35546.1 7-cyano-7-deazaguanine reductase [Chthonomonas calidirosea T49]CEK18948.1 7-cyano-7-deazaguanine reductase [Chthonomonas calidirosea]CEK18963.1 7-cyano-7-deazaguanine reductase [Chthonomonas calidirosea]CEK19951.1 7-cyano-7-deazaguanine reductase [Chthonomonas calidirosea]
MDLTRLLRGEMSREEQVSLLETFDNPRPERDYLIVHTCPEFTSVCPKTGQPDFATITIEYVPDRKCLELKALKLYFFSYRNQGIYYEAVVNRILDDLVSVCHPRRMTVRGEFNVRGGFSSVVTAEYRQEEAKRT